jgi:hypothetical protein
MRPRAREGAGHDHSDQKAAESHTGQIGLAGRNL